MITFSEFMNVNESSLSRLWKKYKDYDSGTISAFRDEYTKEENLDRNAELKSILIGRGYSVTKIKGVFIENYGTSKAKNVNEDSFIVFDYKRTGTLKKDLLFLGERFEQDSITYSDASNGNYFLIGTKKNSDVKPSYHKEEKLGKPMFGEDGVFHSRINGRPFVFTESYDNIDDTILNYNTWHKSYLCKLSKETLENKSPDNF